MRKKIFLISTALMVAIILIIMIFQIITVTPTSLTEIQTKKFTKAICNETNFCQDYEITCERNKTIKINPLENASVQFSSEWQDPRNQKEINKLCN